MWISVTLPLLFLLAATPTDSSECIPVSDYPRSLAAVALNDTDLYQSSTGQKSGRVVQLDLTADPPIVRFEGVGPGAEAGLCIRRDDVELEIVYQLSVIIHDWDGVACVTFDEGRPHSRLFQRQEHNQGREVRLYPFGQAGGAWRRVDAAAGFTHEAFWFECGVTVGDEGLLETLKSGLLEGADIVVRAASPYASDPSFQKKSEFTWRQKVYCTGTGLGVPTSTTP